MSDLINTVEMQWNKFGNEIKKSVEMERDCAPTECCGCNVDGWMKISLQKRFLKTNNAKQNFFIAGHLENNFNLDIVIYSK